MGSWAVWVPAHTVNFAFVPPAQRLLYINSIQIGYNIFLSFLGNRKVQLEPGLTFFVFVDVHSPSSQP